jgi:hypothetical protein
MQQFKPEKNYKFPKRKFGAGKEERYFLKTSDSMLIS